MSHLADYIEQMNAWNKIVGGEVLNPRNLDQAAATRLFQRLDSCLSPENLTCDGELDRATVQRRSAQYRGAIAELQKQGFKMPEMWCL